MKIIAVDDEHFALVALRAAIEEALPGYELETFERPEDAWFYAQENPVDIAFLDIEMRMINGLQLAKRLKETNPAMNIIFVSGHIEYAMPAYDLHPSGYVKKPISAAQVKKEIEHLRLPLPAESTKRVKIKTFGNFDIFVDGEPVLFKRNKAKEILAYLVDRCGAGTTMKELASILWEEGIYSRSRQQQMQTFVTTLLNDLEKAGARDIVTRKQNYLALNVDQVDCDLYRFQAWDPQAVNAYRGEYLSNYSWGEFTAALLDNQKHRPV